MIRCKNIRLSTILCICMTMCISISLYAQKVNESVLVTLQDSSIIAGQVIAIDDSTITLNSEAIKELKISRDDIISIRKQKQQSIQATQEWYESPIYSINYLTESAIPLSAGEMYYQNILLYGQKVGIGLSDHFSINAGLELYSPLHQNEWPGLLIAPKYSFTNQESDFHFGIGGNLLVLPNGSRRELAGTLYGLTTLGDKETNLTIGIGTAFYQGDLADLPVMQLSGQARVARRIGLILDSISLFDGNNVDHVASFFIRYTHPKFIFDLGSVFEVGFDYGIPMVNFAMKIQE